MADAGGPFLFSTKDYAPGALSVIAFTGEERVSGLYAFRIELRTPLDAELLGTLESTLLGRPATFELSNVEDLPRKMHGRVASFTLLGTVDRDHARVAVELVPRLAMLQLRQHCQIFQDKTVREIVSLVLGEWDIKHRFSLAREGAAWPYATQHNESDYAFLTRILAEEGIFFYFEQGDEEEEVVFQDHQGYEPVISRSQDRVPAFRHHVGRFQPQESDLHGLSMQRTLRSKAALLGDFDPGRPDHPQRASYRDDPFPIGPRTELSPDLYQHYVYRDRGEPEGPTAGERGEVRAEVALEQLRGERYVATGHSRCVRLAPGHLFRVEEHPLERLNRPFVVRAVTHKGQVPEYGETAEGSVYDNQFECVPAELILRPPLPRPRFVQVAETAIVVGPSGEEIWTDVAGRVKVQFHWDLAGQRDEKSSCWLRVAGPWAGARHGMQLIPRVGMEVLVTFLGGDPDRPVISGTLYNATHPLPFELPEHKTRSGLRTQSTPGGGGHNELSFEDKAGSEEIFIRAQKDLREEILDRHLVEVAGSQTITVGGAQTSTVTGPSTSFLGGGLAQTIALDRNLAVLGSSLDSVSGNADLRVSQNRTTLVEGRDRLEVRQSADVAIDEDVTLRVKGHLVTIVGQHDARKSSILHVEGASQLHGTGATEISSERGITLRCGDSLVRIGPDAIELTSPRVTVTGDEVFLRGRDSTRLDTKKLDVAVEENTLIKSDKKIVLKGEGGQLQLDRNARLDGDLVKLNCAPDPVDDQAPEEEEPLEPTTIELKDQEGKPLAGQRFILVLPDGSEVGGKLDKDGKAVVFVEESGDVIFPDVDKSRPK